MIALTTRYVLAYHVHPPPGIIGCMTQGPANGGAGLLRRRGGAQEFEATEFYGVSITKKCNIH